MHKIELKFKPDDMVFIMYENNVANLKVIGFKVECNFIGKAYVESTKYKLLCGTRELFIDSKEVFDTKDNLLKSL